MTKDEALRLALRTAFQMGQKFWYHADHEFSSHHKKADAIRAKFDELVEETIKQALEQPEQEPVAYGMWDTQLGRGNRMMMVRLDNGQDGCTVPLYAKEKK